MAISTISSTLLDSYRSAEYHVASNPPFILKIGIFSDELIQLYRYSRCNCSAFITAYNPASQEFSDEENLARNKKLEELIQSLNYQYLAGAGRCPQDNGPGEISFLVLGMSQDFASDVGNQFGQNAVVWCGEDAVPQLVLLK
jgi:hypothetical protein